MGKLKFNTNSRGHRIYAPSELRKHLKDRRVRRLQKKMKILVAGSNKDGNDLAKIRAIAKLEEIGHTVYHTCDIFNSYKDFRQGNQAVIDKLKECDVFYIVCSQDGYTGFATTARLSLAWDLDHVQVITSDKLFDEDLRFYVDKILSPEGMRYLK